MPHSSITLQFAASNCANVHCEYVSSSCFFHCTTTQMRVRECIPPSHPCSIDLMSNCTFSHSQALSLPNKMKSNGISVGMAGMWQTTLKCLLECPVTLSVVLSAQVKIRLFPNGQPQWLHMCTYVYTRLCWA